MNFKKAKIALVFDWMTNPGGAEKVNLVLHKIFPDADIFSSVFNEEKIKGFEEAKITTSFIQKLPFAKKHHQIYLNLMPYAYELFDLSEYDIVISSSHSCSKGIITKPETLHICYCHTPMRYAWDNWQNYIKEYKMPKIIKHFSKKRIHKLRMWDRLSADRVDYFIANSNTTKKRIAKYYNYPSTVIYPMIDVSKYYISKKKNRASVKVLDEKSEANLNHNLHAEAPKEYFLAVGRLIPYKKFDLIVETFNKLKLPLKIVGTGISEKELRRKANANIEFLGFVNSKELSKLYSECEALIFPQLEDFGITPLEAMASGRPVIAFNKGGSLDTIIDNKTGIFFNKQTPEAIEKAIEKYKNTSFNPEFLREHATKFDKKEFEKKIVNYIKEKWDNWQNR